VVNTTSHDSATGSPRASRTTPVNALARSENVTTAYGYAMDDAKSDPNVLMVHQIVQPVIHVSADARSAKIRGRLFQLGGPAGGEGSWISGIYENSAVNEDGTWKLSGMDLDYVWSASSRGGWVRVKTPPTAPQAANTSRSRSLEVEKERPPTKSLTAMMKNSFWLASDPVHDP